MSVDNRLKQLRQRSIERTANNMELYGFSSTVGRLMGVMYHHGEPMTLDDMKDELNMSKTRMSTAIRTLLDADMAEKSFHKAGRKDVFAIEQDYYLGFIKLFCSNWRRAVTNNTLSVQKTVDELEEITALKEISNETREEAEDLLRKNYEAINYYDWLDRLLEAFETNKIFDYVPLKEED
ncbi:GbsR/MarR family transcriptional regulator [Salicibibacter cibi]|uniref:HTH-type transcriptional regulator n=1 Tax=Salicibibacter cibi TaxID=2743001 RepID=A0A7T6ZB40_9BACI|nr:GbsR/MarR family transcriptional regulator [Salicibibacter cibi]QQK80152.1 GbsR/MarR family transcriptional regulator [Salicibibacter cibi]